VNASAIFDYSAQPKERVTACNLCGSSEFVTLSTVDRYGFPVRCDGCLSCGLAFLNPRMTRHAYARFYEKAYRPLVSAFHGREINAQTIQPEQKEYAERLASFLWPHIGEAETLLDIGGSTGVVARHLASEFGMRATVLDPAPDETVYASDMEVIPGFIEDYTPKWRRYHLITLCQTVDHLLDIAGTLRKVRETLADDGLFYVDIVDFGQTRTVKVDHPFNLTEPTMLNFLNRAGFDLLYRERAQDRVHVGFLCR
jgi:hypothetical protein